MNTKHSGGLCGESMTLRVARDWRAVEELRSVWESWINGLHTDIDYYRQNLMNDPTSVGPCVISVWRDDRPLGMLVGQIKERRASATVAMVQIPGPPLRILEIVRKGRIGPASPEVDALLAAGVTETLRSGNAELAFFHRLPIDSVIFQSLQEIPGIARRMRVMHLFPYSVVSLTAPEGKRPEVFSGKIMREARRKVSNLQRRFPGEVRFRVVSQPTELREAMVDVERVNEASWQNSLGADFTDPMQTTESFRVFAEKGWLRIFMLYVSGHPCAFLLGQIYGSTFYCEHAGYHRDFAMHSVGSVLTSMAFEHLAVQGIEEVELGEGGQEHSRRLRCKETREATVHVYAPTLKGFRLRAFFGTAQASRRLGSWTRTNLHLGWIGDAWREFLTRRYAKSSRGGKTYRFVKAYGEPEISMAAPKSDARACS